MCISMCLYMCMSVHVCARDTRLKVRERVPENAHPCIHARAHTHRDPGADGTDIRCAGTKISMRKSYFFFRVWVMSWTLYLSRELVRWHTCVSRHCIASPRAAQSFSCALSYTMDVSTAVLRVFHYHTRDQIYCIKGRSKHSGAKPITSKRSSHKVGLRSSLRFCEMGPI